jgi:hypothetical protein
MEVDNFLSISVPIFMQFVILAVSSSDCTALNGGMTRWKGHGMTFGYYPEDVTEGNSNDENVKLVGVPANT